MTLAAVGKWTKAPEAMMRRAGLVVRVSTQRQADNDEGSLKNQMQRLRQHVAYKSAVAGEDWAEAAVYELKGVSGKNSMRSPELLRLVADIEAGRVNVVICTALDRIARTVKDLLWFVEFLHEHDAEFVCLKQQYDTTTPQGKLFLTIMAALAEFEREQTADRTREATNARSQRGLWNGGRILGYDPDPNNKSTLLPNPHEATVVNAAFDLDLELGSLRETADALNRRGYREKAYSSRRGTVHEGHEFLIQHLQRLLKNRSYIGEKLINGQKGGTQVVPAVWPAIVEREKFEAVQRLMQDNGYTKHNGARETKHVHVLTGGLLICAACGSIMEGRSGRGKGGREYYYYVCKEKACGVRVVAHKVEDVVIQQIGLLAQQDGVLERIVAETNQRMAAELPGLTDQLQALEQDLDVVKDEAAKLLDVWSSTQAQGRSFISDQLTDLGRRREDLEHGIEQLQAQVATVTDHALNPDQVRAALGNIHAIYGELQPYERRELVRLVVHRVELSTDQLLLEINGGVCTAMGETPLNPSLTLGVCQRHEWRPDRDAQSVLRVAVIGQAA